jgi:bacterioferritin
LFRSFRKSVKNVIFSLIFVMISEKNHCSFADLKILCSHNHKVLIMNGDIKLVAVLNSLLEDELIAVNHYIVHAEVCTNRDYLKFRTAIREQAMDEMHYAGWHVERIILINDSPAEFKLNEIKPGKKVSEFIDNDNDDEIAAVNASYDAIKLTHEVREMGTAELLSLILRMEEMYVDWAEMHRQQIEQIRFLS